MENGVNEDHIIEIALDGIENEELRNRFSQNAVTGMEKFQIDSILQKWERIIDSV